MGKTDNYLGNLRVNGATLEDFERICVLLKLNKDDPRLFRIPKALEKADTETAEEIRTKLHKLESKLAAIKGDTRDLADADTKIRREIDGLRDANRELRRQLEGQKKLAAAIVGSLAKAGIVVDGREEKTK